jgi:hypothetical protein
MRVGYIIASHEVMVDGKPIGYLYREEPDNEDDSGWRVFSGEETQEYADDPMNFSMYNASTVIKANPSITEFLGRDYPVTFERASDTGEFVEVDDADGEE